MIQREDITTTLGSSVCFVSSLHKILRRILSQI